MTASRKPYLWMLCGGFWFSLMSFLAHDLGDSVDWQVTVVARSATVLLVALVIALSSGVKLVFFRPGTLWWRSLAGSGSMLLTFFALADSQLPVSDVSVISNTFPLWVALLSWPLLGERPSRGIILAILCSISGVVFTQQPGLQTVRWSVFATTASTMLTAVAMLGLHRIKGVASIAVVVHFSAVATVAALSMWWIFGGTKGVPLGDFAVASELAGVGLCATGGQIFLTLAFQGGNASKVSVVGLAQVVMIMGLEAAHGESHLDWVHLFGIILILGPTVWVMIQTGRERREEQAKES